MSDSHGPEALNILFAASEAAPLAKTGGLADVAGALPPALHEMGHNVSLVMPLYARVDRRAHRLEQMDISLTVPMVHRLEEAGVWRGELRGCPVYLIEHPGFFHRDELYGPPGGAYEDNLVRFTFFCRAVVELVRALNLPVDILHAHDWQTALLPAYIRSRPFALGPLESAASVLTIHNLSYQGIFPLHDFPQTLLPPWMSATSGVEFYGNMSILKAGLVTAHKLTTVSPAYAAEIQSNEGGHGMQGVLAQRSADLVGILNGADYGEWSPQTDRYIPANYGPDDLSGKTRCRDRLLQEFGLEPAGAGVTVLGFVGRLAYQKGLDMLAEALPLLLLDDVRVCILGTGDKDIEGQLDYLAGQYPHQVGLKLAFSEKLAHLVTAGSDILLMPSRFEPCGLSQLYAMRYGTIPLVRKTGGLSDTVQGFDPLRREGTGFVFTDPDPAALFHTLREALWTRGKPVLWNALQAQAMEKDYSWAKSAGQYAEMYRWLLRR